MPDSRLPLFVVTGGSGAGKSTLIAALMARGQTCVEEAGRAVIREQLARGGSALPGADRDAYWWAMFERDLAVHRSARASGRRVFLDRALPDLLGYAALEGLNPPSNAVKEIQTAAYAPLVFAAPPWREIYETDAERRQDWPTAVRTYEAVTRAYIDLGYRLVELPKCKVEGRAEFVLDAAR